jgi:two-component SAPR family response regulator
MPQDALSTNVDQSGVLSGKRVLVVEDDYLIAIDAARVLSNAGAEVVGPFPKEASALTAIEPQLDAAILDINLGDGISFSTAKVLRDACVPFVFLTGYDESVIPDDFQHVRRFEKPADLRTVVSAICTLTQPS